jgi:hypothetical protein
MIREYCFRKEWIDGFRTQKDYSPLTKYIGQDIQSLELTNPAWSMLNKLRRFPDPAAFFYWYQCLTLLGLESGKEGIIPSVARS